MAEDLHPEVGEAGAGLLHGAPAAPAAQGGPGEAEVAADAGHQGVEGEPGRARGLGRLHGPLELGDELAGAEDSLIPQVGLAPPAEALDHREMGDQLHQLFPHRLPPGRGLLPALGGGVDRLGGDAERRREGATRAARPRHPEVGDPLPGAGDGRPSTPALQQGGGDPHLSAYPPEQAREGQAAGAGRLLGFDLLAEVLHELAAP